MKYKRFLLQIIIFVFFSRNLVAQQQVSIEELVKQELLNKTFQTKIPLGLTYSFQDSEKYTFNMKIITETYPDGVKYLAQGGLAMGRFQSRRKSKMKPNYLRGRYVPLTDIEVIPKETVMSVENITFKKEEINMQLIRGASKVELKFKMIRDVDFHDIMVGIGEVLHIQYIESLKTFLLKKKQTEEKFNEAKSTEEKFKHVFKMKKILEEIMNIENLHNSIHTNYSEEITKVYQIIQKLSEKLEGPMILIDSVVVHPESANIGDTLRLEIKYRILAPQKESRIKVVKNIILAGGDVKLELKRIETEKKEGEHVFTTQFGIPLALEPGEYSLIVMLRAGNHTRTVKGSFKVNPL